MTHSHALELCTVVVSHISAMYQTNMIELEIYRIEKVGLFHSARECLRNCVNARDTFSKVSSDPLIV